MIRGITKSLYCIYCKGKRIMLKDAVKHVSVSGCTPAQEREIQDRLKMVWVITETLLGICIDLFEPGMLTMTPGITDARQQGIIKPGALFKRHFSGDYGEIDDEDKRINERSIKDGSCIVSGYDTDAGRVLIITDPKSEFTPVSYTHLQAHETGRNLVCRLLL